MFFMNRGQKKGFKHTEEAKHKISEASKRQWKNKVHRKAMSERQLGEKSPVWKGGAKSEWRKRMKNFYQKRRRARKHKNGGSHTIDEWETLKAQYNWTCPACESSEPEIKLTEDHIIPLSKGGSDNIENIQPLCMKCNIAKKTKSIKYN